MADYAFLTAWRVAFDGNSQSSGQDLGVELSAAPGQTTCLGDLRLALRSWGRFPWLPAASSVWQPEQWVARPWELPLDGYGRLCNPSITLCHASDIDCRKVARVSPTR